MESEIDINKLKKRWFYSFLILCVALMVMFYLYTNIAKTTAKECNEYYQKFIKENCAEYREIKEYLIPYNLNLNLSKVLNTTNTS